MTIKNKWVEILNSPTGDSDEFDGVDNLLKYKYTIDGSPGANVLVHVTKQFPNSSSFLVKASCTNWNGASLILKAKIEQDDITDSFTETGDGDVITKDDVTPFIYK